MAWITGHSILVPYMNAEGPSAGVFLSKTTRPRYNIGAAVRFRWIVPTGATKIAFNLYIHGTRAGINVAHQLIQVVGTGDWVADGTVVLHGITWDRYYIDIVLADTVPGLYSICLNNNGRHFIESNGTLQFFKEADGVSYHHDGGFILEPDAEIFHDDLPYRTELFSRVAGEKAWYEDEFPTAGQLEAGYGMRIRYRDSTGALSDYVTEVDKAWNIVFESDSVYTVGTDVVGGITLGDGAAISWSFATDISPVTTTRFSDEPDWFYDATMARTSILPGTSWSENSIPVHFQLYEAPDGVVHVSARTLHTGIYASHDDGIVVTQMSAAPNDTIGHIRFLDTDSVQFTVEEDDIQGLRGYRPGIIVSAEITETPNLTILDDTVAVGGDDTIELNFDSQGQTATDTEVNFVVVDDGTGRRTVRAFVPPSGSSSLQLQDDYIDVGGTDTDTINFDSQGQTSTDIPVNFEVDDEGGTVRTIRGWVSGGVLPESPSLITRWWRPIANNDPLAGNWLDYTICNQLLCRSEQTVSPWGPLTDALALTANTQTKWEGPAGVFTKVAGKHTQAENNDWPYMAGAMQINQDGYYHIDISQHNYLVRKTELVQGTAQQNAYFSDWHLFLLVYRAATATWVVHHHFDTREVTHPREAGQESWWPKFVSFRRVHTHGSCDIWLNDGDKILFLRSGSGRDYLCPVPQFVNQAAAWFAVLTYHSFNIHWLHDDVAVTQDDGAGPVANLDDVTAKAPPNLSFEYIIGNM